MFNSTSKNFYLTIKINKSFDRLSLLKAKKVKIFINQLHIKY